MEERGNERGGGDDDDRNVGNLRERKKPSGTVRARAPRGGRRIVVVSHSRDIEMTSTTTMAMTDLPSPSTKRRDPGDLDYYYYDTRGLASTCTFGQRVYRSGQEVTFRIGKKVKKARGGEGGESLVPSDEEDSRRLSECILLYRLRREDTTIARLP